MTDEPFAIVAAVYEQGFDLTRDEDCARFVELCAKALAAWDEGGLWGHLAQATGIRGHAIDRVQSLAGRTIGIWQIVDDNRRPTFNYRGTPDGRWWFEES